MTALFQSCYYAGLGARPSLSPRGVSLRRNGNGLTMEKLSPSRGGLLMYPGMNGWKESFLSRGMEKFARPRCVFFYSIECGISGKGALASRELIP